MKVAAYSSPGTPGKPNEDYFLVDSTSIIVIDGATARTETGCIHGASWFAANLGNALRWHIDQVSNLRTSLRLAIEEVAELHQDTCDLNHPGTPSAAVAVVTFIDDEARWLLLGDATILFKTSDRTLIKSDQRGRFPVPVEQQEADKFLIGDPRKQAALQKMKKAELATRNTPDGFWVAASDSSTAAQALTGAVPLSELRSLAVMSDGSARAVDLFHLMTWEEFAESALNEGPQVLIALLRETENADPVGERWPRNKPSDDATLVVHSLNRLLSAPQPMYDHAHG